MLGKLFKYDFKGVARYMLPLYVLLLISTCGMKVTLELSSNTIIDIFRTLFVIAYVVALIAISTGSLIVLLLRFYRNLMSDEGYLSFTLPVTPTAHLTSKLLNGFVWMVFTTIAVLLSIGILLLGHFDFSDISMFKDALATIFKELHDIGFTNLQMISYLIWGILAATFGSQLIAYFCICAGQLFTSHRVLGAFVCYFGWYILNQIISGLLLVANRDLFSVEPSNISQVGSIISKMMLGNIIFSLISFVALFFATRWLLTKKLNLE